MEFQAFCISGAVPYIVDMNMVPCSISICSDHDHLFWEVTLEALDMDTVPHETLDRASMDIVRYSSQEYAVPKLHTHICLVPWLLLT